jgi:predicted transcriptional regulator
MSAIWHNMVVARKQTLVQLSDELLALLDARAARTGKSRSELIRDAIERDLASDREAAIDAAIVAGYRRLPPDQFDPWADAAAVESIRAEPW